TVAVRPGEGSAHEGDRKNDCPENLATQDVPHVCLPPRRPLSYATRHPLASAAIPRSLQETASGVESASAGVAETVDARDLKSLGPLACVGSTPTPGTIIKDEMGSS